MAKQSKARGQAARNESNLKRKTSTDKNSGMSGIAKKSRVSDASDVQTTIDSRLSPVEERAPKTLPSAPDREEDLAPKSEKIDHQPPVTSTRPPSAGSSIHRPVARPAKKGPVNLFIKSNKVRLFHLQCTYMISTTQLTHLCNSDPPFALLHHKQNQTLEVSSSDYMMR